MVTPWDAIESEISARTGRRFSGCRRREVGGGCINSTYTIEGADTAYFVKLNQPDRLEMFAAEAAGLEEIAASQTVRVPAPICWGEAGGTAFLVLEHLDLGGGQNDGAARLGTQLAQLHRVTISHFGWHRDNTIGSTPQINTPTANWSTFWHEHRLGYQLELAARGGYAGRLTKKGDRLLAGLSQFFGDYTPIPSLLHGDLWSGNYAIMADGTPVIFDPATYYGDRETDLAMTELFGGFPRRFYEAYAEAYPLDPGYPVRRTLYNLYHVLNHLNLFGGGYLAQCEQMMDALLREC